MPLLNLGVLLLAGYFVTATETAPSQDIDKVCDVKAWVRAEDLSPDALINGELRVKVNSACTQEVTSVALQLQFDEFTELKYLKKGVTLPVRPSRDNGSSSSDFFYMRHGHSGSPDLDQYYEALRNPSLWEFRAEERTAWKSNVTLFEGQFVYNKPLVVPFMVATPHVNYPPGHEVSFFSSSDIVEDPVADAKHAYHYTALITFKGDRTLSVPAGYTTFQPVYPPIRPTSFQANITFKEEERTSGGWRDQCISDANFSMEHRPTFEAQVIIDKGNVIQAGQSLKGKMILTNNLPNETSTFRADIYTSEEHHWAHKQLNSAGDGRAFSVNFDSRAVNYYEQISLSSPMYRHIFEDGSASDLREHSRWVDDMQLTKDTPFVQFEVAVKENTMQSFDAHYASSRSFLDLTLYVAYPAEVQRCIRHMRGEDESMADASDPITADLAREEGMWDSYTALGKPPSYPQMTYSLTAKIPIAVIGSNQLAARDSATLPVHYLASDSTPSPVLLTATPSSFDNIAFPLSQPVISVEPVEGTIQRMLSIQTRKFLRNAQNYADPTRDYLSGSYAGVLWKKKIVAEERKRVGSAVGDGGRELSSDSESISQQTRLMVPAYAQ